MAAEKKQRCRYQVWERSRWINNYQCPNAARTTRALRLHATDELPERWEDLPVCGVHARTVDRNPETWNVRAYEWSGSRFEGQVKEFVG